MFIESSGDSNREEMFGSERVCATWLIEEERRFTRSNLKELPLDILFEENTS